MAGGLTCDRALAGIPGGHGANTVRREGDLITAILDKDGVAARHIWHIGHRVRAIVVVLDMCLLGLALRVLGGKAQGMEVVAISRPSPGSPLVLLFFF